MTRLNERFSGWWDAPSFVGDLVQQFTDRGKALASWGRAAPNLAAGDLTVIGELILSRRGEVSGALLAAATVESYEKASTQQRDVFMRSLLTRFGADHQQMVAATQVFLERRDEVSASALHAAAEPRRQELFRRINMAPNGTFTLVRMREHLLGMLPAEPELQPVDADFRHLFSSWFNRGFLELRAIDWKTPANVLDAIIRYEAVHEIHDWTELRRRLEPVDRRCFGFFHPQMRDEPLIFVEVALTTDIPSVVGLVLAEDRKPTAARDATTAVFYSISNCQRGLAGVSFGNFLIKQVVADLKRELPQLSDFVTLSPVPGFAAWLDKKRREEPPASIDPATRSTLAALDSDDWPDRSLEAQDALSKALLPLAAEYFLKAKRADGLPIDPVARFHLGNGAQLARLNFLGDRSQRGLKQSHGLMVNYLYRLGEIEKTHETYAENGEVTVSPGIRKLLRNHPGKA